ncbi:MAG: RHS repeat domain-containing protein [Acidimicrobiia bacterium]
MTAQGAKTLGYDLANRLITHTAGSTTTTYSYDGDGKRLEASTGPAAADKTRFLWDVNFGLPQLVEERDGAGAHLKRYVHGLDLISMHTAGKDLYFHKDGVGSVTNVTDASGLPQWSYSYDAFGNALSATKINPLAPDNPMRFTGQYLDPTGLYHLRARQYDPGLGRFTATDPRTPPITSPAVSPYAYVNDRPTVLVDPSGFCGWTEPWRCLDDLAKEAWQLPNDVVGVSVALIGSIGEGEMHLCRMPGQPEAICVENSWLDSPIGPDAFTIGHYIIGGRGDAPLSGCFLRHELTHVDQAEHFGPLYVPGYVFYSGAYEAEANAVQQACYDDLGSKQK